MHAPIACHQPWWMLEYLPMMGHRLHCLSMLGGVRENLVARHDAALHLIKHDLAPKLHQRPALVPWDGARVRLEQAEHLLVRGHLLTLQHAAARLGDDA